MNSNSGIALGLISTYSSCFSTFQTWKRDLIELFSFFLRSYFLKFLAEFPRISWNPGACDWSQEFELLYRYLVIVSISDVCFKARGFLHLFSRQKSAGVCCAEPELSGPQIRYIYYFGNFRTLLVVMFIFAQQQQHRPLWLPPRHVWSRPTPNCAHARATSI